MKRTIVMLFALFLILTLGQSAQAIPSLQLDIAGGYYDTITETSLSAGPIFTLDAYLKATTDNPRSDTYYISAALVPMTGPVPNNSLGSFIFNGQTVQVTGDMTYGIPPLDVLYPNLPKHSIYATFYKEFSFIFSGATTAAYNTETGASARGTMYYQEFNVDVTNLAAGYDIHFDLYNENIKCTKRGSNYDTLFAPFSHDAQSNGHKVPEPSSLWLIGLGLMGLGFFGRKKI